MHDTKRAYTVREFCSAYAVSRTRTFAEIKAGRLKARRVGNYLVVLREDAETWLALWPVAHTARAA